MFYALTRFCTCCKFLNLDMCYAFHSFRSSYAYLSVCISLLQLLVPQISAPHSPISISLSQSRSGTKALADNLTARVFFHDPPNRLPDEYPQCATQATIFPESTTARTKLRLEFPKFATARTKLQPLDSYATAADDILSRLSPHQHGLRLLLKYRWWSFILVLCCETPVGESSLSPKTEFFWEIPVTVGQPPARGRGTPR